MQIIYVRLSLCNVAVHLVFCTIIVLHCVVSHCTRILNILLLNILFLDIITHPPNVHRLS